MCGVTWSLCLPHENNLGNKRMLRLGLQNKRIYKHIEARYIATVMGNQCKKYNKFMNLCFYCA